MCDLHCLCFLFSQFLCLSPSIYISINPFTFQSISFNQLEGFHGVNELGPRPGCGCALAGDGDAVGTVSRGVVNVVMLRKGNQCEQCERS